MAVIRPFNPPVATPQTPKPVQSPAQQKSAAEARAAQRAFFQHALGDSTPLRAAPPAAVAHFQPAQPAREIIRPLPDEPPARSMRPGSFVDIKV